MWIRTLVFSGDTATDEVYFSGSFNQPSGSPYNHIAKWNGLSWDSPRQGNLEEMLYP